MTRRLAYGVAGLALLYALACGLLFAFQAWLIFFPPPVGGALPAGVPAEEVYLETSDGVRLHGAYSDAEGKMTVLYLHGNAEDVSGSGGRLEFFREMGMNALVVDYRGYGMNEGSPKSEKDLYADTTAMWDYLITERKVTPGRIVIWGRSLGGAMAVELAARERAGAVVVESSFRSGYAMAARMLPYLPTTLLLRFGFDSIGKVRNIPSPLLVIHSPEDEVIPVADGQELYAAATGRKRFLEVSGSHNGGFTGNRTKYMEAVRALLTEVQG